MSFVATRPRPSTSAPSDGSRTITVHDNQPGEGDASPNANSESVGRLRLRGAPRNRPRVVWREDVVDNEGAGKKSSKICCIYHKPKKFDESSSEESSDSDSDSSCSHGHPSHPHRHHHPAASGGADGQAVRGGDSGTVVEELSDISDDVNMYERMSGGRKSHKKGKKPVRD
ncbi:hypothetical protein IEO21_09766 [Rhodonia placenta]|uniref:Type 1 phosphatases regulator n=1 Tax=Rhodonia placenta TaxID=104341 RepID=A0A8H7NTQ0_9APHY|nr:hypothetical protein IEO21_09766 [Postia placenta]